MFKLIKSIIFFLLNLKKNEIKGSFDSFSLKKYLNALKNSENLIQASLYFQILLNKKYKPKTKKYKQLSQALLAHFSNLDEKEQFIYYVRASNQINSSSLIVSLHDEDWIIKMDKQKENLNFFKKYNSSIAQYQSDTDTIKN